MKIVAAIPARGGSVGLPGKNIRPLNGIPLVGRTIRAARGSRYISEVYVSSDSDDILQVARTYGAIAAKRPDHLSGPEASSESALLHLIETDSALSAEPPDFLVFLQCTSPFTTSQHIDQVIETMLERRVACAFSVVEDHGFYWRIGHDGSGDGIHHDASKVRVRRQDLDKRYRETGAIYVISVPEFKATGNRFCGSTALVPVASTSIDIDTSQDWDVAEAFIKSEPFTGEFDSGKLSPIRALVSEFDGVHTDNSVFIGPEGEEAFVCNRTDEAALKRLKESGLSLLILTKNANPSIGMRAEKLQTEVIHSASGRLEALDTWRNDKGFAWDEIAFVGDEIGDIECMRASGLSVAPSSAQSEVKAVASVVLERPGGRGALKELSDVLFDRSLLAGQSS